MPSVTKLVLPWPDKALSPNSRSHWAPRSTAVKASRNTAYIVCMAEMRQTFTDWDKLLKARPDDHIKVSLTFEPPARYRYDMDNLVARMKSSLDGIADAIGVDDYCFWLERPQVGPVHKPKGRVLVTLELQTDD